MKKKLEEALARIAALEARVAALEARPYYVPWVATVPQPTTPWEQPPIYGPLDRPGTAAPWRNLPEITCFAGMPESEQPR